MKFMHTTNRIEQSPSWKAKTGVYAFGFMYFDLYNRNYELLSVSVTFSVSVTQLVKKLSTFCGT
jgi:hypothetical protein